MFRRSVAFLHPLGQRGRQQLVQLATAFLVQHRRGFRRRQQAVQSAYGALDDGGAVAARVETGGGAQQIGRLRRVFRPRRQRPPALLHREQGALQAGGVRRAHAQIRFGQIGPDVGQPTVRGLPVVHQHLGKQGVVHHPSTPKIVDDFGQAILVVADQFGVEGLAAFKSGVGQHPLAEAVDGVDGGGVEAGDRGVKPLRRLLPRRAGRKARRQRRQEGISANVAVSGQRLRQLAQPSAQALAQLGGGGLGIGDHQHLIDSGRRLAVALFQQ